MDSPMTFHARREAWELFATLTFKGAVPGQARRMCMLFAWLREVARQAKVSFPKLLWLARAELGEKGGRDHFHVLLSGLPFSGVTTGQCFAAMAAWEGLGGGYARCYIYDPQLSGVTYVMKGLEDSGPSARSAGAVAYEIGKYSRVESNPEMLIPARACLRKWLARAELNRRHRKAREMTSHKRDRSTRGGSRTMAQPARLAHPADLAGRLFV